MAGKLAKKEKFKVIYQIEEKKKFVSRIFFADNKRSDKMEVIDVSSHKKQYCQREVVHIKDGVNDIVSPIKVMNLCFNLFSTTKYEKIV